MSTGTPSAGWTFRIAAALGFLGVALGAFGAHGLKAALTAHGTTANWETAVLYQFVHAIALLALAACGRADRWLAICWIAGIAIFSGSLYVLSLVEALRWLGMITPIGGLLLLAGWLLLVIRGR